MRVALAKSHLRSMSGRVTRWGAHHARYIDRDIEARVESLKHRSHASNAPSLASIDVRALVSA